MHTLEVLKEDTKFEIFMNGEKISTLGTYKKGDNINDQNFGNRATNITREQVWNPENKFEIKANGNTVATLDNLK